MLKLYFSAFAGRTATDPRFNEDPTPCKCGHPNLSSRHIIEQCPIFDQRQKIWNGHAAPPNLTSDMLLDKEWGSEVREFAKKTGLGFRSELIWNSERTEQEFMEEAEEFETGIFEYFQRNTNDQTELYLIAFNYLYFPLLFFFCYFTMT
jgi:hypothetical protein